MSSKENQIKTLDGIESRTHPLSSSIFKIYLKNLHKMCWLVQMRLTWFYKEKKFNDKKFIKNFKKYYLKLFRMEKEKFFIPKFTEWFSEFAEYIGKTITKSDHKTIQETNSSSEYSVSFKNTSVSPAVINSKNDEEKFEEKLKKPKEHIAAQSPHDLKSVDQSVRGVISGGRTIDYSYKNTKTDQRFKKRHDSFETSNKKQDRSKIENNEMKQYNENQQRKNSFQK